MKKKFKYLLLVIIILLSPIIFYTFFIGWDCGVSCSPYGFCKCHGVKFGQSSCIGVKTYEAKCCIKCG